MMGVYSVHLVGESKYQDAIARLRAGDPIDLVPEPDNRHDPRAVKAVDVSGATVGYLERGSWVTRGLLDDGLAVSATVEEIIGGERGKPSRGVVLEVRTAVDAGGEGTGAAGHSSKAAPAPAADSAQLSLGRKLGCGLLLGLLLILMIGMCTGDDPAEDVAAAPPLTADEVSACEEALAGLQQTGLIRQRPEPGILVVEDGVWAALPYDDKVRVLQAASCAAWRSHLPPEGEIASARAFRSGERLLSLTDDGAF
jgi:hypothetical protein